MNELTTFNYENNEVRTVVIDDEVWFVGNDVAKILGFKSITKAISQHVDREDKKSLRRKDCGDSYNTLWITETDYTNKTIINESGVYSLIFGSELPSAKKFKRWVTSEVLPSIRKNGMYAIDELLDNPDLLIQTAVKLKEERTKRLIAEAKVAEYEPKADYVDKILKCQGTMATTQVAFDYGMSARQFNKLLHELGVQYKVNGQWILYTKHQRKGYVKTKTYERDGKAFLSTHWTQKGRLFLYEELKKEGYLPNEHLEVDADE
ncbi:hypothetical protein CUN38_04985 [Enterococcus faecium]|uniref:phage antirepressor KilAC domain-containing protein n=1 Tax=Enterococcus faecium TaxID=1352 RepID=UPI000CF12B9A|nr:phage antirepressor KilAC domain-containing protein [Enterococcus faecium]PQC93547.1 hypothetical protein CUN38_04985 [Enterococcus faecium]